MDHPSVVIGSGRERTYYHYRRIDMRHEDRTRGIEDCVTDLTQSFLYSIW